MGGLLSKYAGSNDIASFATLVPDSKEVDEQPEPRAYDYVILGGESAVFGERSVAQETDAGKVVPLGAF